MLSKNPDKTEQLIFRESDHVTFLKFLYETGKLFKFSWRFFREMFRRPYEFGEIFNQSFQTGNRSLPLLAFISFIIGLVFTVQSHPTLEEFGATSMLPALVAVSLVREIAPVITAILCATTISSKISAELGSMRETEQIDAMEVSGTNPFAYLVVTRVIATVVIIPLLTVFSDFISLYACYVGVNTRQGGHISFRLYTTQVLDELTFSDVVPSIIKSIIFGFTIGIIGSYKGYYSTKGAQGVGKSVNASVVICIFAIFIIDLLVTQIADILNFT